MEGEVKEKQQARKTVLLHLPVPKKLHAKLVKQQLSRTGRPTLVTVALELLDKATTEKINDGSSF